MNYLPFALLLSPAVALAQAAVQIPAETATIVGVQVSLTDPGTKAGYAWVRATPDVTITLARPMKKLCFYARVPAGNDLVPRSSATPDESKARGQRGDRCIDNPSMTHHLWLGLVEKPAGEGPWTIDLGFYDPALLYDYFFAFGAPGGDTLHTQFPVMKAQTGLYNMLSSDFPTDAVLRRRVFLEAPTALFRTLKFAVKAGDLHPTTAAQFSAFPEAGETVVAMESRSGKTTVYSLDGVPVTVGVDALGPFDPAAVKLPAKSRRKPAADTGTLNVYAARELAKAGIAPAAAWVKEYDKHDACYRKALDKLDAGGQAHHYVLIGANGSVTDLDAVVDAKVRKTCKSDASENTRKGLLAKIQKARDVFFVKTSKDATTRLSTP